MALHLVQVLPAWGRNLTSLHHFCRVGDQFRSGVLLYTGERVLSFGDRLTALPLSALWAAAA